MSVWIVSVYDVSEGWYDVCEGWDSFDSVWSSESGAAERVDALEKRLSSNQRASYDEYKVDPLSHCV